ncbi:hypothetical protein F4604DRAFT_1882611 [Suillus subluteus]|nr:hypothetical protein F4604DRAFT_1882611 [Suillus subluteus]
MGVDERQTLDALRNDAALPPGFDEDADEYSFGDVCNRIDSLPISHAGGEFNDLARDVLGDVWKIQDSVCGVRQWVDNCIHRDHVLHRNVAFTEQIPTIKQGWASEVFMINITVIAEKVLLQISSTDHTITSALVRQGVLPCSLISPAMGITMEALELYRMAHIRSPHFSIQAFVKTMCDLHGVEFHHHLSRQFSIAFDVYLQIKQSIAAMVMKSIWRDSPNWCLKHTCLACSYVLADEEQLTFKMLYAMDGNDSLKRVIRRTLNNNNNNNNSDSVGICSELPTGQTLTSDRYLSHTFVDQFAQNSPSVCQNSAPPENLCEGRWKNMDDTKMKKAWGVCDETDMVQSGELAKYPLAVVARMLEVFGDNLGVGYDIGCQFKITLNNSSLGPLVRLLHHTCLVGTFHGHAHRQLCQLSSLTTYIKGLGLEDLKTCERTFSKSNSPASALHYASVFHRQQAIDSYFDHNNDIEVYGNLSNFLHCNYKQALNILATGDATLPKVMQDLRIGDDSVFESWLDEEKVRTTCKVESMQCHAVEDYDRNLKLVQALECKLEVSTHWVPEDTDWQKVGRLIANRKYQCALDHLEGLVVARIFELTKMNRVGTGYKLHKHIAKALQTRSMAIRAALNTYNAIASAMATPRPTLQWEEVVDYAFLADFDLLRNAWADISQLPCAMDLYFKMCQAREEISRLNVEIRHLVVWRFNAHHLKWLHDISMLPGFSGTLVPGLSMHTGPGESASVPDAIPANTLAGPIFTPKPSLPIHVDTHQDLDEEEQEEELAEEASRNLQDVLLVTDGFAWLGLLDDAADIEE